MQNEGTKQPPLFPVQQGNAMPNVTPPDISDSDSDLEISSYEANAIRRREENRQLLASLGLLQVRTYILYKYIIAMYT